MFVCLFFTVVTRFKQGKVKDKKHPAVNETCGNIAGSLFGVAHMEFYMSTSSLFLLPNI